jgi:hypothetical protein
MTQALTAASARGGCAERLSVAAHRPHALVSASIGTFSCPVAARSPLGSGPCRRQAFHKEPETRYVECRDRAGWLHRRCLSGGLPSPRSAHSRRRTKSKMHRERAPPGETCAFSSVRCPISLPFSAQSARRQATVVNVHMLTCKSRIAPRNCIAPPFINLHRAATSLVSTSTGTRPTDARRAGTRLRMRRTWTSPVPLRRQRERHLPR